MNAIDIFLLLLLAMFLLLFAMHHPKLSEGFIYREKDYQDISSYLPAPYRQGTNTWKQQALKDYEFYWNNIGFYFPSSSSPHDQFQLSMTGEFVDYAPVSSSW